MNRISSLLWGRNKPPTPPPLPPKTKPLPTNFAEQVLNLQLQVQVNPQIPIHSINRLIQLYSLAVEYYESQHNPKYRIFKNKITRLLTTPGINRTMVDMCFPKVGGTENMNAATTRQARKRSIENNLAFALQNAEHEVRVMLSNANSRQEGVKKMISSGLEEQERVLRMRIKGRKDGRGVGVTGRGKQMQQNHQPNSREVEEERREYVMRRRVDEESKQNKPQSAMQKLQGLLQPTVDKSKSALIMRKKQEQDNSFNNYLLSPEEIQKRKQKIEKKKTKKKVLTLKANQSAELPNEFNIPF